MKHLQFIDEHGSFSIEQPENTSYLYFPLASEKGLKSSVTPNLGGDAKIDQETFLLEPVSAENLHNNRSVRNFWLVSDTGEVFSASGASAEQEAARPDHGWIHVAFDGEDLQKPGCPDCRYFIYTCERQCGDHVYYGPQSVRQYKDPDPLRRSSCLRTQRRQYTGSQKCDFHAPPHPHGIPRDPC